MDLIPEPVTDSFASENTNSTRPAKFSTDHDQREQADAGVPITRAEVVQIISESLAGLRIYVVESDITEAQSNIRVIVEQASF